MRGQAKLARPPRVAVFFVQGIEEEMRTEGLEPSPLAGQDPKSCVSANSTTSAQLERRIALFGNFSAHVALILLRSRGPYQIGQTHEAAKRPRAA